MTPIKSKHLLCFGVILGCLMAEGPLVSGGETTQEDVETDRQNALESTLPLPSSMPLPEYESLLYKFILERKYDIKLHWDVDKGVRDTGPWIEGKYYGVHPAVRIYYSPKVMYWLTGDPSYWGAGELKPKPPRSGAIPDGAMIVKEMFLPPAARWDGVTDSALAASLLTAESPGWTVMVKDSSASQDGWFWASVFVEEPLDTDLSSNYPNSGFGASCLRCHAVAQHESTFSSLRNIKGFPGSPISYLVDNTWETELNTVELSFTFEHGPHRAPPSAFTNSVPVISTNREFLETYAMLEPVSLSEVHRFPPESLDRVVSSPDGPEQYLTSDQCMSCHSGLATDLGEVMFLETSDSNKTGLNVSPYGEWRWSPMGLAGRDPIFHAQLESEVSILKEEFPKEKAELYSNQTINTCLLCHGAMGKRQLDLDQGVGRNYWEADFDLDWYYDRDRESGHFKYGALGRDGISCLVCHHWKEEYPELKSFLNNSITGQFFAGPPNEVVGPFDQVATLPMEHALGIKPRFDEHIESARLCGSCHTIDLPVVDYPLNNPPASVGEATKPDSRLNVPDKNPNFKGFMHKIEQATFLEWLNSRYQNEIQPVSAHAQTCQECHMPKGYTSLDEPIGIPLIDIQTGEIEIDQIKTKIAAIEDQDYPEADHRAETDKISVEIRKSGYRRHTHQGLNIFLAEVFNQFPDVLGVRLEDYETGSYGANFAINNFVQNAQNSVALEINRADVVDRVLLADVKVTNLAGHRFPSGVGFRRAFVEFLILEDQVSLVEETLRQRRVIWGSGQTNGVGVIVDQSGAILPSEFLTDGQYQPHRTLITESNQVQIYEELTKNANLQFTTSFIHRDLEVKDNRLLPIGWKKEGPAPSAIPEAFLEATYPGPLAIKDPDYLNGTGSDVISYRVKLPERVDPSNLSVRATVYSQSWAPYYLKQRFSDVPEGPDGASRRRLYYLLSNLNVEGTPIEDWKLMLATTTADLEAQVDP